MRAVALAILLTSCRLGFEDQALTALDAFVDVTPPPDYTSGTRLRAIVYDGTDAPALMTFRWYDSQLDEECDVRRAEDGLLRCLPSSAGHGAQFADAACTVPVMRRRDYSDSATCASARQIGFVETGVRTDIFRAARIGPQFTGTLYQDAGGGCTMLTGNSGDYYLVGDPVPVAELVAFREEIVPAGALGYVHYVSDDGASYLDATGFVDIASGARCTFDNAGFPTAVDCIPSGVSGGLNYADAACTVPAVSTYQQPEVPVVQVYTSDLCDTQVYDVMIGAPLSTYYRIENGVCTARATTSEERAWTVAQMQPVTPFASGTIVVPEGSAPVAMSRVQFTSGHSLPWFPFDRARNDICYPIVMEDSLQLRCAPMWSGTPMSLYSDAACTQGLSGWPSCAGTWRSIWFPGIGVETCDGTGIGHYIHAYDIPYAQPAYYREDGACMPLPANITVMTSSATKYADSEMRPLTRRRE